MRPLDLHISALNDDEYTLYTGALDDLALQSDDPHDDAYYHTLFVGVRETRAWLRGKFSSVPAPDVDSILKLFCPNLGQTDSLSGGQFFAALRLVLHVKSGKQLDRALAFVQAHPANTDSTPLRPGSPSKWSTQPQPPPLHPDTPIRRLNQVQVQTPTTPILDVLNQRPPNPFSHQKSSTPQRSVSSTNPFLPHVSTPNPGVDSQILPPLPPRKPPPPIPHVPPPRHGSLLPSHVANPTTSIKTSLSAPAHLSPYTPPQKSNHVTSTLMRQSLQASKTAQSLKKAEEELERERVLSVLKRSRAGSSNTGNSGRWMGARQVEQNPSENMDSSTNVPPLPRRRAHQVPSPPLSSSATSISTGSSLEHAASGSGISAAIENTIDRSPLVYTAGSGPFPLSNSASPFSPTSPFAANEHFSSRPLPVPTHSSRITSPERSQISSPHSSPTHHTTELPHTHAQVYPPPTHPDRKSVTAYSGSTDSFDLIYPDPEQPRADTTTPPEGTAATPTHPTARMSRSKSMHHPTPPPLPPPRRKRPESVQLTPTSDTPFPDAKETSSTGTGSPFDSPSPTRRSSRSTRNLSLSLSAERDKDGSPLTNIQRTIARLDGLQPRLASSLESLQPRLDRARYKAEAGLSWRGYLNHHGLAGKREEEGLMNAEGENVSDAGSADERGDEDSVEADNLKWPAGEGWHPL